LLLALWESLLLFTTACFQSRLAYRLHEEGFYSGGVQTSEVCQTSEVFCSPFVGKQRQQQMGRGELAATVLVATHAGHILLDDLGLPETYMVSFVTPGSVV
jgi:hypothetical protein